MVSILGVPSQKRNFINPLTNQNYIPAHRLGLSLINQGIDVNEEIIPVSVVGTPIYRQ